jgi:hypothetical protein
MVVYYCTAVFMFLCLFKPFRAIFGLIFGTAFLAVSLVFTLLMVTVALISEGFSKIGKALLAGN